MQEENGLANNSVFSFNLNINLNKKTLFFPKDDAVCKDFLQIVDVGSKILLYQNCSELIKPLEILSESNELQVSLTTLKTMLGRPGIMKIPTKS